MLVSGMPSRNTIRNDAPTSFYHVYLRGSSKQPIFLDRADKVYFLSICARHLSDSSITTKTGYIYPSYHGALELLCYCLMGNHFHLMFYQKDCSTLSRFMGSLLNAYTRYFNLKYGRSGPLFESRYKASTITRQDYLVHISRYIHLNPRSWKRYPFSSIIYYRYGEEPTWLQTKKVLELFDSRQDYISFVEDYVESKKILDEIKQELANL